MAIEALPIKLWHERMGHMNWQAIKRARQQDSPLLGIKLDTSEPDQGPCPGCIAGKSKSQKFKASPSPPHSQEPLALVHGDLCSPIPELLVIGHHRYYLVLVCDGTAFVWVLSMKTKDQTAGLFRTWVLMIKKLTGRKLLVFRSDRGGEFMGAAFEQVLAEFGISRETSAPGQHQQNGTAERTIQSINSGAKSMMHHAGLSLGFWKLAVDAAAHVLNRSPKN